MNKLKLTLDIQELKRMIANGSLEKVLTQLIHFIEGSDSGMTTEIYLTSARFRQLEGEKLWQVILL